MRRVEGLLTVLQVLESAPKARAQWQQIAGIDFPVMEPWLRPTDQLAEIYPCAPGCSANNMREVRDWHDPIVAVCRGRRCEKIKLTREEALGHQVELAAVGGAVAKALGATPREPERTPAWRWWTIGTLGRGAGAPLPVILSTAISPRETQRGVADLIVAGLAPFALLLTRAKNIEIATISLLRREKCELVVLEEALGVADGRLTALHRIPVPAPAPAPCSQPPALAAGERFRVFVEKHSLADALGNPRENGNVQLLVAAGDNGPVQEVTMRRGRFDLLVRLAREPVQTTKESAEDKALRRLCAEQLEPLGVSWSADSTQERMRSYALGTPITIHEFDGALDPNGEGRRFMRELSRFSQRCRE